MNNFKRHFNHSSEVKSSFKSNYSCKVAKLMWLKIIQVRYNICFNLQPMIKDTQLRNLTVYGKTIPSYSIAILDYLKEHTLTNFRQLIDIIVYDVPGKSMRFSCVYLLLSFLKNCRFLLNVKTNEVTPIPTLTLLFKSAN